VEGSCRLDRREMRFGQFDCGAFFLAQRVTRLRQRKRGELIHFVVGSSHENGLLAAGFVTASLGASGVGASHSACTGNGCTGNAENSASIAAGSSAFSNPLLSR